MALNIIDGTGKRRNHSTDIGVKILKADGSEPMEDTGGGGGGTPPVIVTGTVSGGTVGVAAVFDIAVITISAVDVNINAGESLTFNLDSTSISTSSILTLGSIQCSAGFPVLSKIVLTSGRATIEILNVGGQGAATADIVGVDIKITIIKS